MTRVPVPDEYERRDVPLPESMEYDDLRGVMGEPGRVAQVREDSDGRYVGVPERYAEKVADFLGATVEESDAEESDETDADDADDSEEETDAETCQTVKSDGDVCGRELPCAYHSDGDE